MSEATGQPQEEDNKPNDQSAHINLKVKGQVCFSFF
jgi:small ubiquitin-related modifier